MSAPVCHGCVHNEFCRHSTGVEDGHLRARILVLAFAGACPNVISHMTGVSAERIRAGFCETPRPDECHIRNLVSSGLPNDTH